MDIRFRRVKERDIDLLLVQELCCSQAFLTWFFEKATRLCESEVTLLTARHSVGSSIGQTDVEIVVSDASGRRFALLIEDKIARTKQPFQAERYKERCCFYPGHDCRIVLVAPKKLIRGEFAKGYQPAIALEDIVDWLDQHDADENRKRFKTAVIEQALKPVPLYARPEFFMEYWQVAMQPTFANLRMRQPNGRRGGSISFHPSGLPHGVRFAHRLIDARDGGTGKVRIIFRGKRDGFKSLRQVIDKLPHNGYEVTPYGRTAVAICVRVPRVIRESIFAPQKESVAKALSEAVSLWAWFCEHRDTIMGAVA